MLYAGVLGIDSPPLGLWGFGGRQGRQTEEAIEAIEMLEDLLGIQLAPFKGTGDVHAALEDGKFRSIGISTGRTTHFYILRQNRRVDQVGLRCIHRDEEGVEKPRLQCVQLVKGEVRLSIGGYSCGIERRREGHR